MVQISITDFTENSNGEVRKNNTVAKEEKRVMTAHMALINFLKGLIGPGCMSLPMAFRQSGLWTGFALVFFIGVLTCLCMLKIVRCSQVLTSRNPKIKTLNYAEMAQESFRQSFPFLRPYENIARRFVNLCIASLIIGICSVHYVFTVDHIMEIVNHIWPEVHISKLSYLVMLIIPFLILSFVRNLVLMSYVSMAGNVFMLFSTVIIFYHLFSSEHVTDKVPWFTNLHGLILTTPAIIYAFGGQVLILPLENKMKHPSEMLGLTGVLSTGMALVTILYAGCGFFGYITYGNDVKASITLNMDDSYVSLLVKGMLTVVVFTGSLIQFYTLSTSLQPSVMRLIDGRCGDRRKAELLVDYGIRSAIVFVSFLFAALVPNLEELIPLVGVTSGMFLAFIIPSVCDITTFLPGFLQNRRYFDIVTLLSNNIFYFTIGVVAVVVGLDTNIRILLR